MAWSLSWVWMLPMVSPTLLSWFRASARLMPARPGTTVWLPLMFTTRSTLVPSLTFCLGAMLWDRTVPFPAPASYFTVTVPTFSLAFSSMVVASARVFFFRSGTTTGSGPLLTTSWIFRPAFTRL